MTHFKTQKLWSSFIKLLGKFPPLGYATNGILRVTKVWHTVLVPLIMVGITPQCTMGRQLHAQCWQFLIEPAECRILMCLSISVIFMSNFCVWLIALWPIWKYRPLRKNRPIYKEAHTYMYEVISGIQTRHLTTDDPYYLPYRMKIYI